MIVSPTSRASAAPAPRPRGGEEGAKLCPVFDRCLHVGPVASGCERGIPNIHPGSPRGVRGAYDTMIHEGIPLTYCFVNAWRFDRENEDGDWDVWSFSRHKAQVHCWRFRAKDAEPEPEGAEAGDGVF